MIRKNSSLKNFIKYIIDEITIINYEDFLGCDWGRL